MTLIRNAMTATTLAGRRMIDDVGAGSLRRATYAGKPGHPVVLGRDHWSGVIESAAGDRGARDYLVAHAAVAVYQHGGRHAAVESGDRAWWQRPDQQVPPGDWTIWLVMAGRGFGKTRAGAEWVRAEVEGPTPEAPGRSARVALVGETVDQVREVMIFGASVMAIRRRLPRWPRRSRRHRSD